MTASLPPERRGAATAILGLGWIAALLILVPGRALEANRFAAPYATAVEAIGRSPADIVLVDGGNLFAGTDLVRNDPYLRNRPTVLLLRRLEAGMLADLCAHRTVALFGAEEGAKLGIASDAAAADRAEAYVARIVGGPCPTMPVALP